MSQFSNVFKTTIILALLTALLLWLGNLIGGYSGLIVAFIFVIFMNFAMYWWSDKIVLWMYRAKELPKDHKVVKLVKEVANKAGIPAPKAYIIQSETPNAFATGRSPKHSAVAVTNGILTLLDGYELKGVLAHELSHVKNRDTLVQTIAAVIAGVISYVAAMTRWVAIFGGGSDDNRGENIIALLVIGIITPIIALLLQLALSRTREYMADEGSAKTLHDSKALSRALKKLEAGNKAKPFRRNEGNPSTAPLFIVNPFKGSAIIEFLSTHPSMEKRIAKLEALKL
ncbi:zinc metalloprotease HtpX [Candidatus Woesearchaeota archaeon]|nr:zinc metalloprotease HtpX [Candidatus Woesearchaeota archaeon]